jgi:hypothetical protein
VDLADVTDRLTAATHKPAGTPAFEFQHWMAFLQPPEELERASSMLPFELRPVLHLPLALRHCFVLRFLVSVPREACARLLHLEIRQVDERARTAMLELPTIQKKGEVWRTN